MEIEGCVWDFYEVTAAVLALTPGRRCVACCIEFVPGDFVSVALTKAGNKLFHSACLEAAIDETE